MGLRRTTKTNREGKINTLRGQKTVQIETQQ